MNIDPNQLLRKLEPPVRPAGRAPTSSAGRPPIDQLSFDSLLTLVSDGRVQSGRAVTARHESPDGESAFSDEQLARLAAAADLAESSGAQTALMLVDGRTVILDVAAREITDDLQPGDSHRLLDIDAAVLVQGDSESIASNLPLAPPSAGLLPPAIAEQLANAAVADRDAGPSSNSNDRRRRAG